MEVFRISYLWLSLLSFSYGQHMKTPPGVPPEKYGMYAAQDMGMHHAQMQQHQVPVQQQQVPVQMQQVPMQQVPMQHQQMHMQQQQVPMQQQQVPMQMQQVPVQMQQQQQHVPHGTHPPQQILNAAHMAQEKDHIREHMEVPIDTSKMSDQELQFHYFKMHDADNNNKLDGCELIKSLIHWHEPSGAKNEENAPHEVLSDEALSQVIDPILVRSDKNNDGFLDYPEYVLNSST